MAILIVSFDLRAPGRDYRPLFEEFGGAAVHAHALDSFWLVETNYSVELVRDVLKAEMDPNDRLLVIELAPKAYWAFNNLDKSVVDWMSARCPFPN